MSRGCVIGTTRFFNIGSAAQKLEWCPTNTILRAFRMSSRLRATGSSVSGSSQVQPWLAVMPCFPYEGQELIETEERKSSSENQTRGRPILSPNGLTAVDRKSTGGFKVSRYARLAAAKYFGSPHSPSRSDLPTVPGSGFGEE